MRLLGLIFALIIGGPLQGHAAISCVEIFSDSHVSGALPYGSFETARTLIRPTRVEDAPALSRILLSEENQKMNGDRLDEGNVHFITTQSPQRPDEDWYILSFSIVSKQTGEVLGVILTIKLSVQRDLLDMPLALIRARQELILKIGLLLPIPYLIRLGVREL